MQRGFETTDAAAEGAIITPLHHTLSIHTTSSHPISTRHFITPYQYTPLHHTQSIDTTSLHPINTHHYFWVTLVNAAAEGAMSFYYGFYYGNCWNVNPQLSSKLLMFALSLSLMFLPTWLLHIGVVSTEIVKMRLALFALSPHPLNLPLMLALTPVYTYLCLLHIGVVSTEIVKMRLALDYPVVSDTILEVFISNPNPRTTTSQTLSWGHD